jgi:hypothetical protein
MFFVCPRCNGRCGSQELFRTEDEARAYMCTLPTMPDCEPSTPDRRFPATLPAGPRPARRPATVPPFAG